METGRSEPPGSGVAGWLVEWGWFGGRPGITRSDECAGWSDRACTTAEGRRGCGCGTLLVPTSPRWSGTAGGGNRAKGWGWDPTLTCARLQPVSKVGDGAGGWICDGMLAGGGPWPSCTVGGSWGGIGWGILLHRVKAIMREDEEKRERGKWFV
jgi:hypothetical protein